MPASRPTPGKSLRSLARLLDSWEGHPCWVVDASGRFVYLSAPCADWTGLANDQLLGRLARLAPAEQHQPSRTAQVAAALAPPAEAVAGHTVQRGVFLPPPTAAAVSAQSALFIPLGAVPPCPVLAIAALILPAPPAAEAIEAAALRRQLQRFRAAQPRLGTLPLLAGSSTHAARLRRQAALVLGSSEHLALCGPAGCGSEPLARALHYAEGESAGPLIPVAGPLMDPELLEATTAQPLQRLLDKPGTRAALLVRDLDQMPLDAQLRLEQLLENHSGRLRLFALLRSSVRRTGIRPEEVSPEAEGPEPPNRRSPPNAAPSPPAPSTASAIFTSGSSLGDETIPLREALGERLSVFEIEIPPLAARVDDLPMIALALLESRRSAGEGRADRWTRAALDRMVVYPWPGHYEELEAAVRGAMRQCQGEAIQPEHLPLAIRSFEPGDPAALGGTLQAVDLDALLQRVERAVIENSVEQAGGNRAAAARRLGISRSRLIRRLDESP